eukprot:scaffold38028_cov21-Tisochrysis_lutea.AAC.1
MNEVRVAVDVMHRVHAAKHTTPAVVLPEVSKDCDAVGHDLLTETLMHAHGNLSCCGLHGSFIYSTPASTMASDWCMPFAPGSRMLSAQSWDQRRNLNDLCLEAFL